MKFRRDDPEVTHLIRGQAVFWPNKIIKKNTLAKANVNTETPYYFQTQKFCKGWILEKKRKRGKKVGLF